MKPALHFLMLSSIAGLVGAGLIGLGLPQSSVAGSTSSAAPAAATTAAQPQMIETKTYVDQTTIGDLFEIQSSELALKKTKNADIRNFAQMMVHDHTASMAKLKIVLKKEKMDVPPVQLDQTHQALLDSLNASNGSDFDASYVKAQLHGHQDALALHQAYATSGLDKGLKGYASISQKIVQIHLTHILSISQKMNITG
jgi:putative membrane protein